MTQKIIAILLCLKVLMPVSFAQEMLEKIPAGKVLSMTFIQQRHLSALPTPLISRGTLKLLPKIGLIWETTTPFPNTLIINQKGIFQLSDGNLNPLSKALQNNMIFDLLSKILEGSFQEDLKAFETKTITPKKGQWAVQLLPKMSHLKDMLVAIDIHGDTHVSLVVIHRAQGDYDEIYFKDPNILKTEKALTSQEVRWFYDK